MRSGIVFIYMILAMGLASQDNQGISGPVAGELAFRKEVYRQVQIDLFDKIRDDQQRTDLTAYVRASEFYSVNTLALAQLREEKPELIRLPIGGADQEDVLELYRVEIFSEGYRLRTNAGGVTSSHKEDMLFYRGVVSGDPRSIAAVSIMHGEVRVMYSKSEGNYRMHQVHDQQYVLYADRDVYQTQSYTCGVTDAHVIGARNQPQQRIVQTGNCVEVYFECDYKSYEDNGHSVSNTEAWVAALFNEVATLYDNEDIPVFISDIMVWTTVDPYAGLNSTGAMLNEFVDQTSANGYDGRLAHLLSTRGLGGGIAYIDVLCSSTYACAVSTSLSTNIVPFPNYSWNVNCVTHEMGHNFGSNHTHTCVWNGNNTQIDDCGSVYGNEQPCYDEDNPILPEDGTIMSYCHLVGVGINFSLGFGPQPGTLIRNEYDNASCNTGICTPPACTNLSSPLHQATMVEVNTNVSWVSIPGASGYRLTIGTSSGSGNIVNNLDVGLVTTYDPVSAFPFNTNIYVKVVPYNSVGNASGCAQEYFTTEPNVAPSCTELTYPLDGADDVPTGADLFWTHSTGNQSGYKITLGTTPGGGEILNLFNVGNVTTYNPGNLPANTTLYVKITPYWAGGDITGCTTESFTTGDPVYCTSQGLSVADEWIGGFSLGTFNNSSGAQGYSDFTNLVVHVSAGESYLVSITPGFDGTAFPEYFRVWIDSNHDGIFQNPGERVFQAAASGPVNGTVSIPLTSYIGVTRMRVAMRYGAYSTPCQIFNWGEVEDYSVRIHCNLVTNTADEGVGSLPWAVGCVSDNETISFASALNNQTIALDNAAILIDSPLSINTNPNNNITVYGLTTSHVFQIQPGVNATFTGLNIKAGISDDGSAIRNFGTLTLNNVDILKHPGITNSKLVKNTGMLMFEGSCQIE